MSTIPFSQVVNVVPSVLSAGGVAVDLSALMLTQNTYAPAGTTLAFTNASSVASYFGANSTEASLASIYFNGYSIGTQVPGTLYVKFYPETESAGWLRGGSLANLTLGQLQALSGTLSLTVAGVAETSGTINLSSATSFSNAASIIQAGFASPNFTVSYDSQHSAFVFTTNTTGSAETITYCSTDSLATGLALTQATGATLSQGQAATDPVTFMTSEINYQQNWATFFTVWESTLSEKEAFATWANSYGPRYLYICQDSDVNALTANNTVTFGNYLQTNQFIGTLPIYGNNTHAAFAAGWAASLDFNRLNGRATLDFKEQSGLVPSISTATNYNAVVSNGYNCYGAYGSNNPANNANWFSPGSVSGKWLWADTYVNQIWLNANIQAALVTLLQAVGSVPYNAQGYSLINAACLDPINAAINFGAIRKGIQVSSAQAAEIQYALGYNAAPVIQSQGYVLQITPAPATVRAARQSPEITLYYQDGESVQQLTVASIAIQ
jgi:Protein of unknown function (DUF3383)